MAPTLRSSNSAQNSPVSNKVPTQGHPLSTNTTPTTTPTRKVPQCSKCKRPRSGHPRSGCPFADSLPMSKMSLPTGASHSPGHLTDALGSMVIDTPGPRRGEDEDVKVGIPHRRRRSSAQPPLVRTENLLSLSTNSNEILARLSQPGVLDDDGDKWVATSKGARIVRWQEIVATAPLAPKRTTKSKTPVRSPMPGTLIPPSPESSFASASSESFLKKESPSANSMRALREQPTVELEDSEEHISNSDGAASESTVTRRPGPLSRTMSAVERDLFVSKLSGEAPATIYIIPKADVDAIVDEAISLKFITELVMNEDEDDPNALIILGREENAVKTLRRKVENENRKLQAGKSKGSSSLRTAAGAVVVGAVGAWAGLAFT